MTYEQIRVLHAIVTEGSFRAAAEKLFKSQPAVSNMIKNLEHELEIQLLSREKYRPVLTEEGAIFYEKALQVLEQMNELAGLAKRLSKHEESIVTIAVNAVCPLRTILHTLKEVQSRYIATQIKLSSEHILRRKTKPWHSPRGAKLSDGVFTQSVYKAVIRHQVAKLHLT